MKRLSNLSDSDKKRVHFIHFNHTNDAIRQNSDASNHIIEEGFLISSDNQTFNI